MTTDHDRGVERLDVAIDSFKPFFLARGEDIESAGTTSEGSTAGTSTADPFSGIDVETEYVRPNGEKYVPRTMKIGRRTVQDVTFFKSAIKAGLPVLCFGAPGCGKTSAFEAATEELLTVQGTIETETSDFVGSWVQDSDGSYRWVDGPLVVAAEKGLPLLIDEIALIDPRNLAVVYGAMDGRKEIVVTQNPHRGVVHVKEGFVVLGAFNPDVPGAVMSDALMSRFPVQIEFTTDWSIASKLGAGSKIIQVVRNLNQKYASGEVTSAPQLREILNFKQLNDMYGEEFALRNFISQIRPENRKLACAAVLSVFGATIEPLSI